MSTRRKVQIGIVALLVLLVLPAAFTEQGDYLGPAERWARWALDGWDMWATDMVRPYEHPLPAAPTEGCPPPPMRAKIWTSCPFCGSWTGIAV